MARTEPPLATYACDDCGARIDRPEAGLLVVDECPECFENVLDSTLSDFWRVDNRSERR